MNLSRFSTFFSLITAVVLSSALQGAPLKAVTWNIEWFPGGRPYAPKEERVAQEKGIGVEIEKIAPDIFLAQEVTYEDAFERLVAKVPGLKVDVFSKFLDPKTGKVGPQQCCIASKLKANSAWFESFKPTENLPNLRRGFAFAALEHPDGGLVMVYSVHFKSNHGSDTPEGEKDVADTRSESAKQIIAHKAEMEKKFAGQKITGWLIGGDFNTNHDGQFPSCTAVKQLVDAGFHNSWDTTPKEERLSWRNDPADTRFKPTTFDYLFTSGFKETQAKLIQGISLDLSDHLPVMMMLEPQ